MKLKELFSAENSGKTTAVAGVVLGTGLTYGVATGNIPPVYASAAVGAFIMAAIGTGYEALKRYVENEQETARQENKNDVPPSGPPGPGVGE